MTDSPYTQGQQSARSGASWSDNPFHKPDKPISGPNYPGDWHHWASGWIYAKFEAGGDMRQYRQELTDFIRKGLY